LSKYYSLIAASQLSTRTGKKLCWRQGHPRINLSKLETKEGDIGNDFRIFNGSSFTSENSLFQKANLHARLHLFWTKITRKCFRLKVLEVSLKDGLVQNAAYAGIMSVPISQIRGTENKESEFDRAFNPLQERNRVKWQELARKKMHGIDLPPVDLVKVGDIYYVRDGHHRISVSRWLNQTFVDAEITVLKIHPREYAD
jgi:hypothetical protein